DREVPGIARHVADVDRLAFAPCRGGDASVERDDLVRGHVFGVVADGLLPRQSASRFINQEEVEELVIYHFAYAMSHALDQLVQVEDGNKFDAQLVDQALKGLGRRRRGCGGVICVGVGEHIDVVSGSYFAASLIASRTSSSVGRKIGMTTLRKRMTPSLSITITPRRVPIRFFMS